MKVFHAKGVYLFVAGLVLLNVGAHRPDRAAEVDAAAGRAAPSAAGRALRDRRELRALACAGRSTSSTSRKVAICFPSLLPAALLLVGTFAHEDGVLRVRLASAAAGPGARRLEPAVPGAAPSRTQIGGAALTAFDLGLEGLVEGAIVLALPLRFARTTADPRHAAQAARLSADRRDDAGGGGGRRARDRTRQSLRPGVAAARRSLAAVAGGSRPGALARRSVARGACRPARWLWRRSDRGSTRSSTSRRPSATAPCSR